MEILVPACQLVGYNGIDRVVDDRAVHYFHILLDHHGIVFADGAPSETLYMGPQVHENLCPREIATIRSALGASAAYTMQPARMFVRGKKLKNLLLRHVANNKPLLDRDILPEVSVQTKLA